MNSISDNIQNVVALLTAITSGQEEFAYEMVLESDPVELFSALTGVLLSALNRLAELDGVTVENKLKTLGMLAFNPE